MARTVKQAPVSHSTWLVAARNALPVYVTGSTQELGEWNPDKALMMRPCGHGKEVNFWHLNLTIPQQQAIEFKFIQKTEDGQVVWEAGQNRIFRADSCDSAIEWGAFRQ